MTPNKNFVCKDCGMVECRCDLSPVDEGERITEVPPPPTTADVVHMFERFTGEVVTLIDRRMAEAHRAHLDAFERTASRFFEKTSELEERLATVEVAAGVQ